MGDQVARAPRFGGDGGMVDSPKFESFQHVRIRDAAEIDNPGRPIPEKHIMGKIGIVETRGLVYGADVGEQSYLAPAYFIRVEGFGPVLVGEDWLEDAPTNG